jgi:hypothetical protein
MTTSPANSESESPDIQGKINSPEEFLPKDTTMKVWLLFLAVTGVFIGILSLLPIEISSFQNNLGKEAATFKASVGWEWTFSGSEFAVSALTLGVVLLIVLFAVFYYRAVAKTVQRVTACKTSAGDMFINSIIFSIWFIGLAFILSFPLEALGFSETAQDWINALIVSPIAMIPVAISFTNQYLAPEETTKLSSLWKKDNSKASPSSLPQVNSSDSDADDIKN